MNNFEWRDVKKDPPEHDQKILACYDFADNSPRVVTYDAKFRHFYCWLTDEYIRNFTHWQPLPDSVTKKEDPNETDWKPKDE